MDEQKRLTGSQAEQDFAMATRAALLQRLWGSLTGRNNSLVRFEDVKKTSGFLGQHYRGLQPVPLKRIVGSLGRSDDFDRAFMPTQSHSRRKWVSVDRAYLDGVDLPAISLYKIGDAYFVVDGHHRLSVARQKGQSFIDAEVIEVQSRVPVTADLRVGDLDSLAAYRVFLEQTKLDQLRPEQNLLLSMPGDYVRLLDHIRVHKYFVDSESAEELPWEEAVAHWYDYVYFPVIATIRDNNLLADFPERTESDLYLWLIDHAYFLSQELGQELSPREVARDFVRQFGRRPRRLINRVKQRLLGVIVPDELEAGPRPGTWREERVETSGETHMFRDVLVTLTGASTSWLALQQAIEIARLEESRLHGLHVSGSGGHDEQESAQAILQEFAERCQTAGILFTSSSVQGDVADQIISRARWADLVVINQRREHGQISSRPLGTIFQTVAAQTPRPVLAVPGTQARRPGRVMLAYDGSPKAHEALFVLRHLVECWGVDGIILTAGGTREDRDMLDAAWQYTEQAGDSRVSTRLERGSANEAILRAMGDEEADLLLMGSYGYQPLIKAVLGSTVDRVLRSAWFPVLICR